MFETIFCTLSWIAIVVTFTIACFELLITHNWQMAGVYAGSAGIIFFGNVVIAALIAENYLMASSAMFFFASSCFIARLLFQANGNSQRASA